MKNLSINTKLIAGFGIVLIIMLFSIALSVYNLNAINQQVELYGQYTLPNNDSVWSIRRDIVSSQRNLLQAFAQKDPEKLTEFLTQANQDGNTAAAALEKYALNQRDADLDQKISEVREILGQVSTTRAEIIELLKSNTSASWDKAYALFNEKYRPQFNNVADILVGFSIEESRHAEEQRTDAQNTESFAFLSLIICAAVSIVLSVVIAISIRRSIVTPVKEIERVYTEMSKGNMAVEVNYHSRDELGKMAELIRSTNKLQNAIFGDIIEKFTRISQGDMRISVDIDYPGDFSLIKEAIENTVSSLNETLHTINTAAEQVSAGSSQVSSGAQSLAAGSTEQASSVEELSVSVAMITEQATENSANVKTAAKYVGEAGSGVETGNEHMVHLTQAMDNISSSSSQIASITKVIEDIAFQTNILALNAAIEAARAGSAGKGFAVVADEVRSLAAKSAEAAKQTGELIERSTSTVNEGSHIASETAKLLRDVGEKARKAIDSIIKIETATAEQAGAIDQIRQGLSQVSSVVQTNAATAEENSATSEEMSAQAAALREEVSRFKLASVHANKHLPSSISLLEEDC